MSLQVYLRRNPPAGVSIERNVEVAFLRVTDFTSDYATKVLSEIDKATAVVERGGFLDRFGAFLYWECLSTGCKAALSVYSTDACIDTLECGWNAVEAIMHHAHRGCILIQDSKKTFTGPCDLVIQEQHFSDLLDFTHYLREEVF